MMKQFQRADQPELYCIELRSAKWEESLEWYRSVLGLRVLVRVSEEGYALLEAGNTRLALLSRKTPGEPSRRISLAFEVGDLRSIVGRMQAAGYSKPASKQNEEGLTEINITDPDGNRIRLFTWPRH